MPTRMAVLYFAALLLAGCASLDDSPPVAPVRPHELQEHGQMRIDPYYWLRDDAREAPEVLAYLEAENAYLRRMLAHTEPLQQKLYEEMVGRIQPDEESVPYRLYDHWYYRRYEPGKEQPIHARRAGRETGPEQILLDENELGADHEYYRIGGYKASPDDRWLAYAEDTVSRRQYDIRIRSLDSEERLADRISNTVPALVWSDDSQWLYYVRRQPQTMIPFQVWRHRLGSDVSHDKLIYEESDPAFSLWLQRSRDKRHLLITAGSTLSTEVLLLDPAAPGTGPRPFLPREAEHEYSIDPLGEWAYIRTNWQAENFRIMRAPLGSSADKGTWEEVVPGRPDVLIEGFTVFEDYLVLAETERGISRLRVQPLSGSSAFYLDSDEPAYRASLGANPNTDTSVLRYVYSSLTTPDTTYDLDLANGERVQRKREFAGSGFDPDMYRTERLYIAALDGAEVPVSLLHRRGAKPDGSHPVYILGYGAYGSWYEPDFRRDILSLVDRGFVFAIAHIRGGSEMGRAWYEGGKLLRKKNTFTDFVDVSRALVQAGWAHPDKVVGMGRSAGGLLIGAVANMAPDAFTVLVTEVPFVDVITTMYDESIPLTTFEYDEWGNPRDDAYYRYMLSYSPYDQVRAQSYPHMLVSAGLWDSQVQYWEPAKWVAKLRASKTDDNRLLLYTDMSAGHGGGSGRFERKRDRAREYAFILDTLGMGE